MGPGLRPLLLVTTIRHHTFILLGFLNESSLSAMLMIYAKEVDFFMAHMLARMISLGISRRGRQAKGGINQ